MTIWKVCGEPDSYPDTQTHVFFLAHFVALFIGATWILRLLNLNNDQPSLLRRRRFIG